MCALWSKIAVKLYNGVSAVNINIRCYGIYNGNPPQLLSVVGCLMFLYTHYLQSANKSWSLHNVHCTTNKKMNRGWNEKWQSAFQNIFRTRIFDILFMFVIFLCGKGSIWYLHLEVLVSNPCTWKKTMNKPWIQQVTPINILDTKVN